jgi:uncharacterized membrane protein SirB2
MTMLFIFGFKVLILLALSPFLALGLWLSRKLPDSKVKRFLLSKI